MDNHENTEQLQTKPYRVLARTYRPTTFSELIGQDAMVRTLTNAIATGRLAHAFMLTGVRGTGKTTTARLIARALNCVGPDGNGGPTISSCGQCEHCLAIAEDRHMDVTEIDAASHTGVDNIREVIDGVRYRPTSARTKIYIIDEIHMLSKNAFNALLKTLEEPPEHVKFIFATTEVRKVPVTVLSRCQRFDLRRIDAETLAEHFGNIAQKEGAEVSEGALHLIARAADGSVRDGLSLLDQAIAHCTGAVGEDQVRAMIGLADRTQTLDLFEAVMKGDGASALDNLARQYSAGADPAVVVEDMLELAHWLTRVKVVPEAADDPAVPEAERVRGRAMAETLSMPVLTLSWQMLLKGLGDVRIAPSPMQAAEMVLIRLAFAADLPTPADAVAQIKGDKTSAPSQATPKAPAPSGGGAAAVAVAPQQEEAEPQATPEMPDPQSFAEVIELVQAKREMILHANLTSNLHLVTFAPGQVEFRPGDNAPEDLARDLSRFLNDQTARRWLVTVSSESGAATLLRQQEAAVATRKSEAAQNPFVREVLDAFPGAEITDVRD